MEVTMIEHHEPDSRFLERLEWQLSSEFRRAGRLKSSLGRIAVPRKVATLSLMVGVLMTGVAVMKAADYIKDSRQKKVEMARVEAEVRINEAHLESVKEMESRAKLQFSNGLIRDEEYLAMKQAAARAELDLKRSRLNEAEVKMSGETPRNELSAPLVGGRDFVSERLKIEKEDVELDIELLGRRLERFRELVKKGLIQGVQSEQIQAEMAARKAAIAKTQERLDVRKRFLAGEITAREAAIKDRQADVENNLKLAQSKVDSLKEQLKRLEMLASKGIVSPSESNELRYALTAAEAELQLAGLEMEALEKVE
jgi:multidrug resistance efflux pump